MGLIELGGWMMWPLLAVSVAALAIIVERALVFMGCPFPDARFSGLVSEAVRTGDVHPLAARLEAIPSLRDFTALLTASIPNHETALRLSGETVLERLETRLSLLSILARLAPLMGLLGTILGMITTFSRIAEARSGVDMALLAGGIWQALLTTAAGLCIAIPALFFLFCFQNRVRRVADALNKAGNVALLVDDCWRRDPSDGQRIPAHPGADEPRLGFREGDNAASPMAEGIMEEGAPYSKASPEPSGNAPKAWGPSQRLKATGGKEGDGGRIC